MLILSQLVQVVGNLKPISGGKEVQMERILTVGQKIDAVENRLVVADIVVRTELGSVQESPRSGTIHGQEFPKLGRAAPNACGSTCGAERSIRGVHIPKEPWCPETRAGRDLGDQTALVSEFRAGRTGSRLHALNGAGGELGGEHFALLIADGLSINHETDLGVVAQGMKESVPICGNSAGAVNDRLA